MKTSDLSLKNYLFQGTKRCVSLVVLCCECKCLFGRVILLYHTYSLKFSSFLQNMVRERKYRHLVQCAICDSCSEIVLGP